MSGTGWRKRAQLAVIAAAVCVGWLPVPAAPQGATDVETLMTRVGERVAEYYRRAQTVVGVERSTVRPIEWDAAPDWSARTVESELRVEPPARDDAPPEPKLVRNVLLINGRAPRERDMKERTGCTDPDVASPDPLAFLLPFHRDEYEFLSVSDRSERGRATLVIKFRTTNRTSKPELIEDPRGHADCFDWSGPVASIGRVWVDATTFEVVRLDRYNPGPVEVRVPWKLQQRYHLPQWIVVDRNDLTVRYSSFAFSDPEEVLLLPQSVEELLMVRSSLQSIRRSVTVTSYRRFLTKGRMIKP